MRNSTSSLSREELREKLRKKVSGMRGSRNGSRGRKESGQENTPKIEKSIAKVESAIGKLLENATEAQRDKVLSVTRGLIGSGTKDVRAIENAVREALSCANNVNDSEEEAEEDEEERAPPLV